MRWGVHCILVPGNPHGQDLGGAASESMPYADTHCSFLLHTLTSNNNKRPELYADDPLVAVGATTGRKQFVAGALMLFWGVRGITAF